MSFVEASIRRLSPLRRGNLQRRLMDRIDHDSDVFHPDLWRAYAILGRFSALTAGLEVR